MVMMLILWLSFKSVNVLKSVNSWLNRLRSIAKLNMCERNEKRCVYSVIFFAISIGLFNFARLQRLDILVVR